MTAQPPARVPQFFRRSGATPTARARPAHSHPPALCAPSPCFSTTFPAYVPPANPPTPPTLTMQRRSSDFCAVYSAGPALLARTSTTFAPAPFFCLTLPYHPPCVPSFPSQTQSTPFPLPTPPPLPPTSHPLLPCVAASITSSPPLPPPPRMPIPRNASHSAVTSMVSLIRLVPGLTSVTAGDAGRHSLAARWCASILRYIVAAEKLYNAAVQQQHECGEWG